MRLFYTRLASARIISGELVSLYYLSVQGTWKVSVPQKDVGKRVAAMNAMLFKDYWAIVLEGVTPAVSRIEVSSSVRHTRCF